ncbi:hypothetical protein ACFX1X_002601 [Malus domestica]
MVPGDEGGGGIFRWRLDDVVRDSLIEVSEDFSERASDAGRVGIRKRFVKGHQIIRTGHSLLSVAITTGAASPCDHTNPSSPSRFPQTPNSSSDHSGSESNGSGPRWNRQRCREQGIAADTGL